MITESEMREIIQRIQKDDWALAALMQAQQRIFLDPVVTDYMADAGRSVVDIDEITSVVLEIEMLRQAMVYVYRPRESITIHGQDRLVETGWVVFQNPKGEITEVGPTIESLMQDVLVGMEGSATVASFGRQFTFNEAKGSNCLSDGRSYGPEELEKIKDFGARVARSLQGVLS